MKKQTDTQAAMHPLDEVVEALCRAESNAALAFRTRNDAPMPSSATLREIVETLRAVIFPGYHSQSDAPAEALPYYIGAALDKVLRLLPEQIKRGYCFTCPDGQPGECEDCEARSRQVGLEFIRTIPEIRRLLATDVMAAYEGDPAAKNPGETVFCYPSIRAVTNYRIAHELYRLDVPIIPRIIGEMAHSETGIDIHPGATIGERFFIDHGTGTVIGETCVIGRNVRLYQGVTLGAKSFPTDEQGNPIKGIARHPIVEDNVIIYSGATILGRVSIGHDSVIGGNTWLTRGIPPHSRVLQAASSEVITDDTSV